MANNQNNNSGNMVALGAGAIALAAATYHLFGPEGKQHRKQAKGWMIKAKGEIIEKLEEAKEMSEPIYHGIIDSVVANYQNRNNLTREDLDEFTNRLKKQWKQIYKEANTKTSRIRKKK